MYDLRYVDADTTLITAYEEKINDLRNKVERESRKLVLLINKEKLKIMIINENKGILKTERVTGSLNGELIHNEQL